jgi:hypothetical protein
MNGQESECKVGESKEEHKVLKQRERWECFKALASRDL